MSFSSRLLARDVCAKCLIQKKAAPRGRHIYVRVDRRADVGACQRLKKEKRV